MDVQAIDLPVSQRTMVMCSIVAAVKMDIPANLMIALAETEGGKPGQWVKNTNGSFDVGPMQFNTTYLIDLAKYGIKADDVAASGCYAYDLAAWRVATHIRRDEGDIWTRAANYHSRTLKYNAIYREKLMSRSTKWADWLSMRYRTHEYAGGATSTAWTGTTPRANR